MQIQELERTSYENFVTFSIVFSTGLDYVAHEDVVPYTSTETSTPIHHELFDKFLIASPENCKFKTFNYI